MLVGEVGPLEGVRAFLPLLHEDSSITSTDDYYLLVGIDSETDDLPLGRVRDEWDSKSLREKDREIARCEDLWRDKVLAACERILLRTSPIQ